MRRVGFLLLLLLLGGLSLSGCFSRAGAKIVTPTPSPEPVAMFPTATFAAVFPPPPGGEILMTSTPFIPTPTSPPVAVAGNVIPRVWISLTVPVELQASISALVNAGRFTWGGEGDAQVRLTGLPPGTQSPLSALWVYVPVARFGTVANNVAINDILRYWRGDTTALAYLSNGQPPVFVTTATIYYWMTLTYGLPAQNLPVQVVAPDQLATAIWSRPAAWGMIPFDRLDRTLTALTVDGINIFDRALNLDMWPFKEVFGITGDASILAAVAEAVNATGLWQITNRDLDKLTLLIMTGVTALTRATAFKMETIGINYPARDIAPFFADGDIIHTSNEVSFAKNCPYPNPYSTDLVFCSAEKYFDLLKTIRVGVVELTGNHVNDWGVDAMNNSLDMYDKNNMVYFGGGRNTEDARKAAVVTHNGNTIAFLGCNPAGPPNAWAGPKRPGSAQCDDTFLAQEIPQLKAKGYLVVMTLQFQEVYEYAVPREQQIFFAKYAKMGADIVMGSQAHQPQGFGFVENAFIHYGIGNLFFDQMWSLGTRQMFADKLILYNGRHISTILYTGLIEDFARPRPMTSDERASFLELIFSVSNLK